MSDDGRRLLKGAEYMTLFSPYGGAQRDGDTGSEKAPASGKSSDGEKELLNPAGDFREEMDTGFALDWELQNKTLQDGACRARNSPFWQPTVNEAQNSLLSPQTAGIFGDVKL